MDENIQLVQDIMLQAIKINNTQKPDIRFEFFPLTKVLRIDIYINGKCGDGLTKSWSVKTTDVSSLNEVIKDLNAIDETEDKEIEEDFLG
jgi:hypothetical protein